MPRYYHQLPDDFTRDYIEAALDTTSDDDGEELSRNYSAEDIDDETVEDMILDCQEFQEANASDLELVLDAVGEEITGGNDFWLTRNDHGVGFRDRGYGQPQAVKDACRRLADAAKKWGDYSLWVGTAAELNPNTRPDAADPDDDGKKKIYAYYTRASDARYEQKKRAISRRATAPHGRCANSNQCLEHAADSRVQSCKKKRRN